MTASEKFFSFMCAFVLCCFTGGTVWFWYAFSLQKNNMHSRLSIHHPYKNLQTVSAFTSTTSDQVVSDGFATSTHAVQEVVNLQKKDEVMLKKPAPSNLDLRFAMICLLLDL